MLSEATTGCARSFHQQADSCLGSSTCSMVTTAFWETGDDGPSTGTAEPMWEIQKEFLAGGFYLILAKL